MTAHLPDDRPRPRPMPAPSGGDAPRARRATRQHVFAVDRTEQLSPHLIRVHLGGPAFAAFVEDADPDRLTATDKYVKLQFARPELGLVPPYDLDALRDQLAPEDMPVRRTYTVRSLDRGAGTIAIDFVWHGDEGVAGPWAAAAEPGALVSLSGPGGAYAPSADPDADHLLLGDDSAVPAIAAALEAMPAEATGRALLEVDSSADELSLTAPAGIEIRWLHRRDAVGGARAAGAGTLLADSVRELTAPSAAGAGATCVFAHGEREAIKSIRRVLQGEWGLDRRAMSLSAYWAAGRSEDRFQAEKREPVGQIFDE